MKEHKKAMSADQRSFVISVLPQVRTAIRDAAVKWRTADEEHRGDKLDYIYASLTHLRLKLQEQHGFILRTEFVWQRNAVFSNSVLLTNKELGKRPLEIWADDSPKHVGLPFTKEARPSARSSNFGGLGGYDTVTYLNSEDHQRTSAYWERRGRNRENNE